MPPISTHLRDSAGFSLIELLIVMAIIGLLAALAVPAFNSIGQARGVSEAASQVALAVELARSEAIARQTYVWLGLQPQTNSGRMDLRLGIVYSKDGQPNPSAANLVPIGRPPLIRNVGLESLANMDVGVDLAGASDLSTTTSSMTFEIGASKFTSGHTLTFSPLGEVMLDPAPGVDDGFDPRLAVGLRQARGTKLIAGNDIAVVIDGSVATPTVYTK